jgi:hypothetical protein
VTYPLREEYELLHIRREVLTWIYRATVPNAWFLELQCLNERKELSSPTISLLIPRK